MDKTTRSGRKSKPSDKSHDYVVMLPNIEKLIEIQSEEDKFSQRNDAFIDLTYSEVVLLHEAPKIQFIIPDKEFKQILSRLKKGVVVYNNEQSKSLCCRVAPNTGNRNNIPEQNTGFPKVKYHKYVSNFNEKKENLTDIICMIYRQCLFNNEFDVPVKWSDNLTNEPSICLLQLKEGARTCLIEISESLVKTPADLQLALVHQFAHAANWIIDCKTGHGPDFEHWLSKLAKVYSPGKDVKKCQYPYIYKCILCASMAFSHKIIPHRLRCAYCTGPVDILQNNTNESGPNTYQLPVGYITYLIERYIIVSGQFLRPHSDIMTYLYNSYERKHGKLFRRENL